MKLNRKQAKTLKAIFEIPVRADVLWTDIVRLLEALGAEVTQGRGSRVRVHLRGVRAVFHEPHPEKETDKGALRSVREFLENAGITEGEDDADL
jgi:predicted RNA binding protein YcfA (HicA-like mRNA interferase family)